MLLQRRIGGQVIVVETHGRQAEIDQIRIGLVKSRQYGVGGVDFLCCRIVHIEYRFACDADGYVSLHDKQFDMRVLHQLPVDFLVPGSGKIEGVSLLFHDLEYPYLGLSCSTVANATSLWPLRNSNAFSIIENFLS